MKKEIIKPKQGLLLISEPFMNDDYFGRSVVLIADHNKDGSFGIILNKPLEIKVKEIIKDYPADTKLFLGGPVKTDNLFIIHSLGDKIDNSLRIKDDIYWGGNVDSIIKLLSEKEITEEQFRFFIGYSGWSKNQLENELEQNSWVLTKCDQGILTFNPSQMWKRIIKSMGADYSEWLSYPPDPLLN